MLALHPALEAFTIVQELSPEGGDKTLLARSKSGSLVAIKVLVQAPIPQDIASALSREASLAARLDHEAIIKMRAVLLEPDFAALVTEFVPGVALQRLLRFAAGRSVRIPDDAAWYVVERMLAALAHAHAYKDSAGAPSPILHRALSPSSIVVGWDGTVKLGDFGFARMRSLVTPLLTLAESESPLLVAPEQARGSEATDRSDIFCAALVALRLATGRTPYARFRRSAAQMMIAMSDGEVSPLSKTRPELPLAVREVFDRALAADPAKRDVTAQQLLDVVRASFDMAAGKAALAQLATRWRAQLEESVTPWERRSIHDAEPGAPASGAAEGVSDGALALAMGDDRPSSASLFTTNAPSEPWNKSAVPKSELPLAATDPATSMSRIGSIAPDALVMPLPAMRMTMPSLPVYGGPVERLPLPPVKKKLFSGGVAAFVVFVVFVLLIGGAVFLLRSLAGPS